MPSCFAVLVRAVEQQKSVRVGAETVEVPQKGRTIVGGIREDRIEFFHALAFHRRPHVTLIILYAVKPAAASLDGMLENPAGYSGLHVVRHGP